MRSKKILVIAAGAIFIFVGAFFLYSYFPKTALRVLERNYLGYYFWTLEAENNLARERIKIENVSMPQIDVSEGSGYAEADKKRIDWIRDNADVAIVSSDELLLMEKEYPGVFKGVIFFSETKEEYMSNIVIKNNSTLSGVGSLSGKSIAVKNETEGFLLEHFLKNNKATNYSLKRYTADEWAEKLATDKIDAALITEPQGTQFIQEKVVKELIENPVGTGSFAGTPTYAVIVRTSLSKKDQRRMENYVDLLVESIKIDDNRLREIMADHLGEGWAEVVAARKFARVQNYTEVDRALLQQMADDMEQEGFVNFKLDISGAIYGQ